MTSINAIASKKEKGFTLIELVLVIVILGVLSAFALPRFADLSGDARAATLAGAEASVKSAAAIAHSAWLAGGEPNFIVMDGTNVVMSPEGYPESRGAGIGRAAQINDDFDLTDGANADINTGTIAVADATGTCQFQYNPTTGGTTGFDDSGC